MQQWGQDLPRSCVTPWPPGVTVAIDGPRHTVRPPDKKYKARYTRHPAALKPRVNPTPPVTPGTTTTAQSPPLPPLPAARTTPVLLSLLPPLPPTLGGPAPQATSRRPKRRRYTR